MYVISVICEPRGIHTYHTCRIVELLNQEVQISHEEHLYYSVKERFVIEAMDGIDKNEKSVYEYFLS